MPDNPSLGRRPGTFRKPGDLPLSSREIWETRQHARPGSQRYHYHGKVRAGGKHREQQLRSDCWPDCVGTRDETVSCILHEILSVLINERSARGATPDKERVESLLSTMNAKLDAYETILSKQKYLAGDVSFSRLNPAGVD